MLENVSVDVVEGARVKGVLGCPSVPGGAEGVKYTTVLTATSGPPGGAVRCGAVRSEAVVDHNDRGVGLSPVARNTIRDSSFDVKSCIRHAAPTGGGRTRGEALICTTDE